MKDTIVDTLLGVTGSISRPLGDIIAGVTGGNDAVKQKTESEIREFFEHIGSREEVQNILTRYRLQLFQIREMDVEIVRRANMASTRMGRVQQMLSEQSTYTEKLQGMLRQKGLDGVRAQLEEAARQMNELERHLLQTELALAGLEKLVGPSNSNGTTDMAQLKTGNREQQQKRMVHWDNPKTEGKE